MDEPKMPTVTPDALKQMREKRKALLAEALEDWVVLDAALRGLEGIVAKLRNVGDEEAVREALSIERAWREHRPQKAGKHLNNMRAYVKERMTLIG